MKSIIEANFFEHKEVIEKTLESINDDLPVVGHALCELIEHELDLI